MHWIQKHIMRELSVHASRRYSQLKPRDVDGNLFMYHLKQLQQQKWVQAESRTYELTESGKTYASSMSLRLALPRQEPKIVIMLVCRNEHGQYALFRYRRQPYFDKVGFPFGKVHYGRSIAEQVAEEAQYKLNIQAEFAYRGSAYIQTQNSELRTIDHMLAHIFTLTHKEWELYSDGLVGQPLWGRPQEITGHETVAGFHDIVSLIEHEPTGFFKDIVVSAKVH